MTGKDLAKGAVTVGGTLAKWGVQGAGVVLMCGVKAAFISGGIACNLAKQFSGDSMGTPIANAAEKAITNGTRTITKTGVNGVNSLTKYIRDRV